MQVHNIKRLGQLRHRCQLIVSKVEVCQSCQFLKKINKQTIKKEAILDIIWFPLEDLLKSDAEMNLL